MSGNPSGDSSLHRVKLIGRTVAVIAGASAFLFRAFARGRKTEPAIRHAAVNVAAPSPPSAPPQPPVATAVATAPQADESASRIHMPHPTIWPLVLSLGITLVALGILTNLAFTALGILCMIWAIAGWIGDLRHG